VLGRDPQDRADLGAHDVRPRERQADPAAAEERVGLGVLGEERQRLVGADVERADHERAAVEGGRDLGQRGVLLLLAGRVLAAEEEELRAQEADALGALRDRARRLGDGAEVRGDLDPAAVASVCGRGGALAALVGDAALLVLAALGGGERVGVGVDGHGARVAVEDERRAVGGVEQRRADPDDRRDPERAREDRGVRRRAPAGRRDAPDEVAVKGGGLARGQVLGDEHPRAHDRRRPPAGPGEVAEHAAADVAHVGGALLQVGVAGVAVRARGGLDGDGPRLRGVAALVVDRASRRVEQRVVVEQEEVGVEDRGLGLARAGGDRRAGRADVGPRRVAGGVEGAPLVRRVAGGRVGDHRLGLAQALGGADRDAGRDGQAAQRLAGRDRGGGRRRALGLRRRGVGRRLAVVVAEVVVGQRLDRVERAPRLGPARADEDLVALAHAERGERRERPRAHRPAARRLVGHLDLRVGARRGADEPRRGAGVQPEPVADDDAKLLHVGALAEPAAGGRAARRAGVVSYTAAGVRVAELLGLRPQRPARLRRHLVEARADPGRRGRRDGALDDRRGREHDPDVVAGHLDRHLGAHQRAAEVHKHEHAVRRGGALDRLHDDHRVGAHRPRRIGHPARGLDRDVLAAHLARELHDALGELRAVRDDDQPDAHEMVGSAAGVVESTI
jgi:hypothetical protein